MGHLLCQWEGFWRRPSQPHIREAAFCGSKAMWCHIDAANLSVREKTQSGLLRAYLHNVSHPLVRVQTWGAWLLTWLNLKLRRRLADKLMLLKITCFPELLRHNLINGDTSHCWFLYTPWNFFKPAWKWVCGTPCSRILPQNLVLFSIMICKQPLQLFHVFTAVPFPPSTSNSLQDLILR